MRLLVCMQAADSRDPALSFLLTWITELAKHFQSIEVICLKEGQYDLPANVRVHSLGKESVRGSRFLKRFQYISQLIRYVCSFRASYDRVLVFQNEEYVLAAGWLWMLLGKPAYLWRNHYDGTIRTTIAAACARKVFYTSQYSYTARFRHAQQMPLGIDLSRFTSKDEVRTPNSVLFFSRIAPSKRAEILLEAVAQIVNTDLRVSIVGDPLPQDGAYYESLKESARRNPHAKRIQFSPGVPHEKASEVYGAHEISVNISRSGMYDKTIFEAAASGCLVLASSKDFALVADPRCIFEEGNSDSLAQKIRGLLALSVTERESLSQQLRELAARNSIATFGARLKEEIAV